MSTRNLFVLVAVVSFLSDRFVSWASYGHVSVYLGSKLKLKPEVWLVWILASHVVNQRSSVPVAQAC